MISIENLKNKKISGVGRNCDLVWIAVGNIKEAVDWNNKKRLKSEYYIHIQTSFRLVKNNRIVISDRSIYQPIVGEDWSQPNNSTFDSWCKKSELVGRVIKKITVNQIGDVIIDVDNYTLEIVNLVTDKEGEVWRILSADCNEQHYVCLSKGGKTVYEYQ